jgi:hypothetical protein
MDRAFARLAHLSDDEAVAKMGHPILWLQLPRPFPGDLLVRHPFGFAQGRLSTPLRFAQNDDVFLPVDAI